jgi:hypothetical protein
MELQGNTSGGHDIEDVIVAHPYCGIKFTTEACQLERQPQRLQK